MQVFGALLLAVLTGYRIRNAPLSEGQARTVFDVERIATGLSVVTGGVAVFVTVVVVALGVAGVGTLETYLSSVAQTNPFTEIGIGPTVGHLSVLSVVGAVVVLGIREAVVRALSGR
jgi:hypothetical protein